MKLSTFDPAANIFLATHGESCENHSDAHVILYEDMKPIEHILLHLICVLSFLMCACKHCNTKLSVYY